MEKPKNYPKNFTPLTPWYKIRLCMGMIMDFMQWSDKTIKEYSLFDFRAKLQRDIDQEWKEI